MPGQLQGEASCIGPLVDGQEQMLYSAGVMMKDGTWKQVGNLPAASQLSPLTEPWLN